MNPSRAAAVAALAWLALAPCALAEGSPPCASEPAWLGIGDVTRAFDGTSDSFALVAELARAPLHLRGSEIAARLVETPLESPLALTAVISGAVHYRYEPPPTWELVGASVGWLLTVLSFPLLYSVGIPALVLGGVSAVFAIGWTFDVVASSRHVYRSDLGADVTVWRDGAPWTSFPAEAMSETRSYFPDPEATGSAEARLRATIRKRLQAELEGAP